VEDYRYETDGRLNAEITVHFSVLIKIDFEEDEIGWLRISKFKQNNI
jgi:hypothetical protein